MHRDHHTPRERTALTVAELIRTYGPNLVDQGYLRGERARFVADVVRCRTPALGGYVDICAECGHVEVGLNSCRNRHCPQCQWTRQQRWIEARSERLLDTHYFHVVFTLPQQLRALARANPREVYALLMRSASATLLELGRDPAHLGAELAVTAVLHTWNRELRLHPHVHALVSGGGPSVDGEAWIATEPDFLFPVAVMGALFRGKMLDGLRRLHRRGEIVHTGTRPFARVIGALYAKPWVVYSKPPMLDARQVITYLGRYTHRVAISDARLVAHDEDAHLVTFRTRGAATKTVSGDTFVKRLAQHVLPSGFVKIRHSGLLASVHVRHALPRARALLAASTGAAPAPVGEARSPAAPVRECRKCQSKHVVRVVLSPNHHLLIVGLARPPPGHLRAEVTP